MSETTMPVAEAIDVASEDERNSYEFAFHVLPTVAEGEVSSVFDKIKAHITKAQGELFDEEKPDRIDLAYPVVKHLEGSNRKFTSAYFGWVRFRLVSESLAHLIEELDAEPAILRSLIVKLTKVEEETPFRFHEHRRSIRLIEVDNEEVEALKEEPTKAEGDTEVSDAELEESLEKITGEEEVVA